MGQKYIIGGPGAPVAFDASLPETSLENKVYCSELHLALHALQAGATPPTIANLLAPWNPISIIYNGAPIHNARAEAYYALMVLWLKRNPITVISANDNERLNLSGLPIPIWTGPDTAELKIRITRVAPAATLDTLQHTITQRYTPARPPNRPVWIKFMEQSWTPTATGVYQNAGKYDNQGTIIGMLIFSTTIPVTGANTTSARGIKLTAPNIDDLEADWFAMGADDRYIALRNSPADLSIIDNYRYWDLSETPIPPGSNPQVQIFADDTNAVRYYFIEEVPAR